MNFTHSQYIKVSCNCLFYICFKRTLEYFVCMHFHYIDVVTLIRGCGVRFSAVNHQIWHSFCIQFLLVSIKGKGVYLKSRQICIQVQQTFHSFLLCPSIGTHSFTVSSPWEEYSRIFCSCSHSHSTDFHSTRYPLLLGRQRWCGLSKAFTHDQSSQNRTPDPLISGPVP